MDDIQKLYEKRNAVSKEIFDRAFAFKSTDACPFVVNNANYFLFGERPQEIPDDYFTSPASMYQRQVRQFKRHYELVEDHFVPYLMPFFGTGVLCSAFGSTVEFQDKMDPASVGFIVKKPEELRKLTKPDCHRDGLMPRVLEFIRYFRENSNIPVGITDCQGPLTTALQIVGYENLFYWMYDYPSLVHEFMELLTESLITWIKVQKQELDEPLDRCAGNQGVYVPQGTGVWLSDDDAILMPPDLYKEFVVPYNDRIMKEFGSGILHFCGAANQQIENFKSMKYLRGINNFSLGDEKSLLELKEQLEGRVVIIACDFTPIDYQGYYRTLFEQRQISRNGLVVQSLFSPITGVKNKKYQLLDREESTTVKELQEMLSIYTGNGEGTKWTD